MGGFGPDHVRHLETGKRALRVSQAVIWAHALGCNPHVLLRAVLQDQLAAGGVVSTVVIVDE